MKKVLIALLLFPVILIAQELDANVRVNYEQLSPAEKDRLVDFDRAIEKYLNTTKFSGSSWEWSKIKCNFEIFFVKAYNETNYEAQVVITSQRPIENSKRNSLMLSILDSRWNIVYEENQSMFFIPDEYDPLTSFLDFYAHIIIGFDMDTYGPDPLQGNEQFSKAYETAILGAGSGYSGSWETKSTSYNKRGLVNDLMNEKFAQFREDIMSYHFNGLDILDNHKDIAQQNIVKLIKNLEAIKDKINPRSVFLKVFFDAKHGEIIDYLKDYEDNSIFQILGKIDPPHISKYNKAMDE
jgi:hypothetical protein